MKCIKCGNEIAEGARFCPLCGSEQMNAQNNNQMTQQSDNQEINANIQNGQQFNQQMNMNQTYQQPINQGMNMNQTYQQPINQGMNTNMQNGQQQFNQPYLQPQKKNNNVVIFVVIGILAIGIIVLALILLNKNDNGSSKVEEKKVIEQNDPPVEKKTTPTGTKVSIQGNDYYVPYNLSYYEKNDKLFVSDSKTFIIAVQLINYNFDMITENDINFLENDVKVLFPRSTTRDNNNIGKYNSINVNSMGTSNNNEYDSMTESFVKLNDYKVAYLSRLSLNNGMSNATKYSIEMLDNIITANSLSSFSTPSESLEMPELDINLNFDEYKIATEN